MKKIEVLDCGFVDYIDHMGSDLMVVNSARVSFAKESDWDSEPDFSGNKEQKLAEKDKKLIAYLAKHKHWTPFAHPQITLRIKAPIFVRTQLFKHKVGFTENEISRRYVDFIPDVYVPFWRGAPTDGAKQGSSGFMKHVKSLTDMYTNHVDDESIYIKNFSLRVLRQSRLDQSSHKEPILNGIGLALLLGMLECSSKE